MWEGGVLYGRCEGFLSNLLSGECAQNFQTLLFFRLLTPLNKVILYSNVLSVDNVYCRLKFKLKWKCDISTIFQTDSVREPLLASWIQPVFLNLLVLVVWIGILTTKQLDSLRTQAELLFLSVHQGCDPEQEACKCFLMISCGLRVLPAVIVKGLFSVSVVLLLLFFFLFFFYNFDIKWLNYAFFLDIFSNYLLHSVF